MKRREKHLLAAVALVTFCVLAAGPAAAQSFRTIRDGIEHATERMMLDGQPVQVNLLRLDPKRVRLDVVHALDLAVGTETTSSIARRHHAFAAINAGFFRLDTSKFAGEAAGTLIIDGELLSESFNDRAVLRLTNTRKRTEALIGHLTIGGWFGSFDSRFEIKLSGVNRERKDGEIVLYGAMGGLPTQPGTDIILDECSYWKDQLAMRCRLAEVRKESTGSVAPKNGYVISAAPGDYREKTLLMRELQLFEALDSKRKRVYIRAEGRLDGGSYIPKTADDAVNGVPLLIKNGQIVNTWEYEKASRSFAETRHPRTAVAILKDGKLLMITIDGRQPGISVGMTLKELAEYLLGLGAIDAINLDGGGSTTMFLDGKVVNSPSDKEGERKVSDAIIVTPRDRSK